MNILHITDFHYSNRSSLQTNVVQAIIAAIKKSELSIDFVFFTGDLVENGSKIENFSNAKTALFDKLVDELGVKKENVIFCPGNHDIDRNNIHTATKSYFDANINNDESLNNLYNKKNDSIYIDSVKPSNNFYSFLSDFHNDGNNINEDIYSIHFRIFNSKRIGIVCLNSAWLSAIDKDKTGKDDKGNLLIPNALMLDIKKQLVNIEKKIILIHHPLYFLKEFNLNGVESIIHNEFDLMFSGHVHKISSISRHSGSNGIFEHIAKASLSSKENLGCSIIELSDIEENKIIVKEVSYIVESNECHIGSDITHTIPCGDEKQRKITFRKKIFDKISIEKDNAKKLLLEEDIDKGFLEQYKNLVLKKESSGTFEKKNSIIISIDEILSSTNNYCVLGKDKCGKTSLLKKIQLECLISHSRDGRIPFYFDAKEYENKLDNKFEIELYIRNYFEINREKVNEILNSKSFVLLIDNYSPNTAMADYLNNFLKTYQEVQFIACSEYNLSREIFEFGEMLYEKIYFHDIRRQEIVSYVEMKLPLAQNKEIVFGKIIQLCKQLELPLNYWTVQLLLLIHTKSSDSYSKNLFSILDVCVDEIFDKKQLLINRSKISFEQLKTVTAELSKYLFENYEETIYSATADVITKELERMRVDNGRISATGDEIFNFLLSCGMLKQKNEKEYIFRLNGFFEYFLALQMTQDVEFKDGIVSDEVKYLAFKNQLEIYSGFKRDDIKFLTTVSQKTKDKLNPLFSKYNYNKDQELLSKIKEPEEIEKKCREISITKSMTVLEKAKMEDEFEELTPNADVHLIRKFNPNDINSDLLERYISILARIFKNSDNIKGHKDVLTDIFNQIINYYCDLGFFIVDEFTVLTEQGLLNDEDINILDFPELELLKFISNFTPILCQTLLFDGLGHYNLEQMIKNEINNLEKEIKNNQYKLFMLYFLLLDIDLNANQEYVKTAITNLKVPLLRYAITLKLNYYLAFKTSENKQLQQFLSKKIQDIQLQINNKTDIGDLQRQIQKKKIFSITNTNKL